MKKLAWAGIDPGANGALCLLTQRQIWFHDFKVQDTGDPIVDDTYNWDEAAFVINKWNYDYRVKFLLEKIVMVRIPAYKKKGTGEKKPEFMAGQKIIANYGTWRGILIALHCNFIEKVPQSWQTVMPDKSKDWKDIKDRPLFWAKKYYPAAAAYLDRKKDSDRADALLMAHYLKQQELPG